MAGMLWLANNNYDVRIVTTFDYELFAQQGVDYLTKRYGTKISSWQTTKSDIPQEQRLAQTYLAHIHSEKRTPDIADLESSLRDGYLVLCNINSRALKGNPGYTGHFVVLIGYNETELILHNSGLPPQERQIVSQKHFLTAWAYPNDEAKSFTAIKLKP